MWTKNIYETFGFKSMHLKYKISTSKCKNAELPLFNGWLFKAGTPCISTASLLK